MSSALDRWFPYMACGICLAVPCLLVGWVAATPWKVERMHFESRTSWAMEPPEYTPVRPLTFLDHLTGPKFNATEKPYCGPSFCFSSESANCFQKHPAQLCMKAVYLCIQYIVSGQSSHRDGGPWRRGALGGGRMNSVHPRH
eukprot:g18481.t1